MFGFISLFFLFYSLLTSTYILTVLCVDGFTLYYNNSEIELYDYFRSLNVVCYNIFIIAPIYLLLYTYILLYGFTLFNPFIGISSDMVINIYDFNMEFNILYELINILITLISAEIFFYFSHRLFHSNKFLYRNIHKLHHKYSLSVYGVHAQYCSVYECIMNLITSTLGTLLIKHHIITIVLQSIFMIIINVLGHTTNEFRLFGKLIYSTKEHNKHHLLLNGNYGLLTICDRMFNTRL